MITQFRPFAFAKEISLVPTVLCAGYSDIPHEKVALALLYSRGREDPIKYRLTVIVYDRILISVQIFGDELNQIVIYLPSYVKI